MSTVSFLNVAMHGRINPTLPVAAELVRRGHLASYHTTPAFRDEVTATGATVFLHPGGDQPLPDPPTPVTLMERLARTALCLLPAVLTDLRSVRPDLIVHDNACLWGAVAARELDVPAAASFTTFAFNRQVPSPTRGSWNLLAEAVARPRSLQGYLRSRWGLYRRFDTRGMPLLDLLAGALVEGAVFAIWPLTAWAFAQLVLTASPAGDTAPTWTPALIAPLVLAAILAFPLLGPLLHLLLLVGVGAGLAGPVAAATGLGWWAAAACVAVAGVGLALAVKAVRRVVAAIGATGSRP